MPSTVESADYYIFVYPPPSFTNGEICWSGNLNRPFFDFYFQRFLNASRKKYLEIFRVQNDDNF